MSSDFGDRDLALSTEHENACPSSSGEEVADLLPQPRAMSHAEEWDERDLDAEGSDDIGSDI